jgi:hypothetical protein
MAKRHLRYVMIVLFALAAVALLPQSVTRADFGTNWTAQYFNSRDLSGAAVLTQTGLPGVNYSWGSGSPGSGVNSDDFSARFTSTQTFAAGTYDFVVTSDDGVRVFIDGVNVLDRFTPRPLTTDRFTQNIAAGTHSLIVEYFEAGDQASIQFQWFLTSAAGGGGTVVTPVVVTPGFVATFGPTPIPVPTGPQASVTFVRGLALRTGPYMGATMVTALTRETSYSVSARNRSEGIYNWYFITTPSGRQGWASGRYLQLNVDVNSLPEAGSVFDQIDNAPDVGARAIPRAWLRLRSRPSIRSPQIGMINYGEEVQLIGRTVQGGTNRWFQVRRGGTGEVGWIFAPYVTVHGEINAVPIR